MVIVVFRSRLVPEVPVEEFDKLSNELYDVCSKLPGFISERSYTSDDGERLTLVEFESEESLRLWREDHAHSMAQQTGRERYYEEYTNQVCTEIRRSEFKRSHD
jgi:heme-degrading monooxygenase HmoA